MENTAAEMAREPENPEEAIAVSVKRALVARVAASDLFQKAPRLHELFLYVAECTLEDRLAEVREQVIAERVFGRRPDFQGTQDSIVRAEARNLRKRLESYFATAGREEPIVIGMPKGGYALSFELRPAAGCLEPVSAATPVTVTEVHPARASGVRAKWLAGICILLAAAALGYFGGRMRLRDQLHLQKPILPFSALFAANRTTLMVTSDTGFLQIAYLAHHRISLDDYIARTYPQVPGITPPYLIRNWNLYEFTDGREMNVAGLIMSSYPQFAPHIELRSGHKVTLEDLKTHTAVLIGSPISNPWAQLYENRLNFHCEFDNKSGRIFFRDRQTQYPSADDVAHGLTYARLAFLPGSASTPAALLIAGTTAQATEAAGELVASRTQFARVLRKIGIDPSGPPHFFEILLRSNVFVGGSTAPEVVAWRLSPAPES
ncbi:MAG: hypothetical protein ACRD4Q_03095 [Candidatus Acidiferrales bacterium]